nr:MAG TPA: hypothetical protein [Caudoviricetes sp.]
MHQLASKRRELGRSMCCVSHAITPFYGDNPAKAV